MCPHCSLSNCVSPQLHLRPLSLSLQRPFFGSLTQAGFSCCPLKVSLIPTSNTPIFEHFFAVRATACINSSRNYSWKRCRKWLVHNPTDTGKFDSFLFPRHGTSFLMSASFLSSPLLYLFRPLPLPPSEPMNLLAVTKKDAGRELVGKRGRKEGKRNK